MAGWWSEALRRRGGRARRSGVALLFAMTTLAVLTVLVTEMAYTSRVRLLVAQNEASRAQAYWLARSGVNIYRLVLMADKQIGDKLGEYLPGVTLWEMVPVINTGLMRMLFASGGDVDDVSDEAIETFQQTGQVDEATAEKSREEGTSLFEDKNFLDFEGDFSAEIHDQAAKINLNNLVVAKDSTLQETPTALQIYGLLSGEDNERFLRDRNLDRWELIANIADWIDTDNMRMASTGGYEDVLYNHLDSPYLAKNAPFDTKEELRLVAGWQDDVYDRFASNFTIYGSGKLNVQSIPPELLVGVIKGYCTPAPSDAAMERLLQAYADYTLVVPLTKGKELVDWLSNTQGLTCAENMSKAFTSKSRTFEVSSTGLVGTSSVTITAVLDYSKTSSGSLKFWSVD